MVSRIARRSQGPRRCRAGWIVRAAVSIDPRRSRPRAHAGTARATRRARTRGPVASRKTRAPERGRILRRAGTDAVGTGAVLWFEWTGGVGSRIHSEVKTLERRPPTRRVRREYPQHAGSETGAPYPV